MTHNGKHKAKVSTFEEFVSFVQTQFPADSRFIFRGHLSSQWELLPSLFRHLDPGAQDEAEDLVLEQLASFKLAARGRCSMGVDASDDEWWAYGQHFGLKTPLLDWTLSPYVALFFAFADLDEYVNWTEERVIFALDRKAMEDRYRDSPFEQKERRRYELSFIEPFTHENPRLTSQSGLFTLTPTLATVDEMVEDVFEGEEDQRILTRIYIPDNQRIPCLRGLRQMNIHHLSLFPDIEGASKDCNLSHDLRHRKPGESTKDCGAA